MRDYLSRVVKNISDTVAHPSAVRAAMFRRPAVMAAVFLIALVLVLGLTRLVAANDPKAPIANSAVNKTTVELESQSTTSTTEDVSEEPQVAGQGGVTTMTTAPENNDTQATSQTQSSVTVNGQQIEVPENGSVTRTVESSDGTTTVNISNSSSNTNSGSSTSSSLNVSTFSQPSGMNAAQVNRYLP